MAVKIFFILLAALFSFQIFYQKGYKKLLWFVVGILFFPNSIVLIDSPIIISFPRLLIYSIILDTVIFKRDWKKSFRAFPLKNGLLTLLVMLLLIGLFDHRLSPMLRVYRPVTIFCENFFLLFVSFYYIRKVEETFKIYKVILSSFLVFGLFGLVNYFQHKNIYYLILNKSYGVYDYANVNMVAFVERFRISSFAWHAIYYGLLLAIAILLCIFFLIRNSNAKQMRNYYFLIVLLLINLFMVNSRTPLFALMTGFLVFFFWAFSNINKLRSAIALVGVLFLSVVFIPKVQQLLVASVETVSSKKPNFEDGSSVEMRIGQLQASIALFNQSPVFGNGIYYIKESLGYTPDYKTSQSDKELYGFESYLYLLLIEQGLLGIIGNLFLITALFIFFIKSYKVNDVTAKNISLLSLSLLVAFLAFIFATGDMGAFTFFMLIMGVNIKTIIIINKSRRGIIEIPASPIKKRLKI